MKKTEARVKVMQPKRDEESIASLMNKICSRSARIRIGKV